MAGKMAARQSFTTGQDLAEKYTIWAARLGLTKSQFLSIACALGANVLARQAFPEDFVSVEVLQKAVEVYGSKSMDLDSVGLQTLSAMIKEKGFPVIKDDEQ